MDIKVKPKKQRCWKCKKTSGTIKFYLMPGDEKVRFYHPECYKLMEKKHGQRNRKKV